MQGIRRAQLIDILLSVYAGLDFFAQAAELGQTPRRLRFLCSALLIPPLIVQHQVPALDGLARTQPLIGLVKAEDLILILVADLDRHLGNRRLFEPALHMAAAHVSLHKHPLVHGRALGRLIDVEHPLHVGLRESH